MDAITRHHYHNIAHGKAKQLEDGDLATVRTTIVEIDGVETLIPTIWDGKEVDIDTAVRFAKQSGVDWPTRSGPDAIAQLKDFDRQIHQEMTDQTTPQEAAQILSSAEETSFALGGLATARRGITTQEGEDMANNKTQLDRSKADKNKDGKLSKYEETVGMAVQDAMADDPDQDEKVKMSHGGMAMMGDYDEGLMSNYDPVSGNPIPLGSSAENVRDDIDAKISTDEYVLPAHVVKWHGLKYIQMMQSEAEMGLMSMDMSGLIQEVSGEEDEYADHMMYDPQTGEGKMTKSNEEHLDLKSKGWSHEGETQEPDSEGSEDAQVSDASGSEQEEKETLETPEGNQIEVAGVETTLIEPEVDETEDYKKNKYGKSTGSFGIKKNPSVAFIM